MTEQKGGISLHLAMQFPVRRLIKASAPRLYVREENINRLLFCVAFPYPQYRASAAIRHLTATNDTWPAPKVYYNPAVQRLLSGDGRQDPGGPRGAHGLRCLSPLRCPLFFSVLPCRAASCKAWQGLELVHPLCAKFGLAVYWPDA